jgi:hypothetical protein
MDICVQFLLLKDYHYEWYCFVLLCKSFKIKKESYKKPTYIKSYEQNCVFKKFFAASRQKLILM